ncbi:hypothetical protein LN042_02850 [Kitasatospora sp. RB6PN24]|uniref:hypothetical protein n=1 Tax=Kitasatospora humi TaxID=2893891 RepID=UPI001E4FF32D|nr:hypothetical protein [Kitasatospora humi]MCC9306055.1 hypothetical protein [Kitasatospora humi]
MNGWVPREGRYPLTEDDLDKVSEVNAGRPSAADADAHTEDASAEALPVLPDAVRGLDAPLSARNPAPPEPVPPDSDMSLAQVRALLTDERPTPR